MMCKTCTDHISCGSLAIPPDIRVAEPRISSPLDPWKALEETLVRKRVGGAGPLTAIEEDGEEPEIGVVGARSRLRDGSSRG